MPEIVDKYGRVWTSDAPPGAFSRRYDASGRLVSYCIMVDPPVHTSNQCRELYGDAPCPIHERDA